ncbi:hypothetical protein BH23ACI1_BH23ACI1_32970 [soil metagenome]
MTRRTPLRTALFGASAAVGLALLGGCAAAPAMETRGPMVPAGGMAPAGSMAPAQLATMLTAWPATSREVAETIIEKYGAPHETTASMLIWHNNGPWKRTIVYRDTVPHHFPMPHPDLLEQVVNYRVPLDRYDEIAQYDGSVIVERTKGEMAARCDKEGANFLALNLAHEVATGRRTVEEARRFYGEQIRMMKNDEMTPYTSGLMFTPPASGADPDQPIM